MWRMNVSASIQSSSSSPSQRHSARRTSRSKRTCSVSVGVNAVKSWRPGSARAHSVSSLAVQRVGPPERVPACEDPARAACEHAVAVGAAARVAARVEARGRRLSREHGDVGGQQRVEPHGVDGLVGVAGDLSPGVHPAVGAPGDGQRERLAVGAALAEDRAQRALELLLHGAQPGLAGPAGELAAVVLEGELGDHAGMVAPRTHTGPRAVQHVGLARSECGGGDGPPEAREPARGGRRDAGHGGPARTRVVATPSRADDP